MRADDGHGHGSGSRPEQNPPERSTHRGAAVAMLAIGGLTVAGGLVALGLDQDSLAAPRGMEQEQYYWNTTPPGIAAIATGTVVAGIGVYLFFRDRKPATSPQVTPVGDGAVVGVAGRF